MENKIDRATFVNKILRITASRAFIPFMFVSILFTFAVWKMFTFPAEHVQNYQAVYSGLLTLEGAVIMAVIGRTAFDQWVNKK